MKKLISEYMDKHLINIRKKYQQRVKFESIRLRSETIERLRAESIRMKWSYSNYIEQLMNLYMNFKVFITMQDTENEGYKTINSMINRENSMSKQLNDEKDLQYLRHDLRIYIISKLASNRNKSKSNNLVIKNLIKNVDLVGIRNVIGARPKDCDLDHKVPLKLFNILDPIELSVAYSPKNLHWMNWYQNRHVKNGKLLPKYKDLYKELQEEIEMRKSRGY